MRVGLLPVLLVALAGCGAGSRPRTIEVEETRIVGVRGEGGEVSSHLSNPVLLFDDGNRLARDGDCPRAVACYDELVRDFPASRYVSPALYNAGLCLQGQEQWEEARARYERLLALRPDSTDVPRARFQLAEVLEALEQWEPARVNAEALLARDDLRPADRLEALARRARAVLGLGRLDEAAALAREALAYYRTRPSDQAIADETFAAMCAYVLAETIRLRAEALTFSEGSALEQHELLERRARLLLDAQRAYFDTIRLTNPDWAAAAGYRIGSMYRSFFDAITRAPVPPPSIPMTDVQRALYEEEYRTQLREQVLPLVRHAIRYWELTLTMVERTGAQSPWLEQLRQDLERARALVTSAAGASASPGP